MLMFQRMGSQPNTSKTSFQSICLLMYDWQDQPQDQPLFPKGKKPIRTLYMFNPARSSKPLFLPSHFRSFCLQALHPYLYPGKERHLVHSYNMFLLVICKFPDQVYPKVAKKLTGHLHKLLNVWPNQHLKLD